MLRFTAEFGMGSGGSTTLWSSGKLVDKPFARFIEFIGFEKVLCIAPFSDLPSAYYLCVSFGHTTQMSLRVIWSSLTDN